MRFVKYSTNRTEHYNSYIRKCKCKDFTYIYHFYWDHDEDLNTEHIKSTDKPEYIRIRAGKRAVFYENISEREQIPNNKK